MDDQTLVDEYKPYENNFTPVNPPENSVSRNAAAGLERCSHKVAPHACLNPFLRSTLRVDSLKPLGKPASEKYRIGETTPRHLLSPVSDILMSKGLEWADSQKSRES